MTVRIELAISPHPKKDVEETLVYAVEELTAAKESIEIVFPEKDPKKVILQFWMPDKAHYKVVDKISEQVRMSCWEFYEDSVISFENDRKRKPRSRRRT